MQNNGRRWGRTDPGSGIAGPALPRRDGSFSTGFSLLMNKPQRVSDLLQVDSLPRLEARMLLQHVLRVSRTWLITHDTDWVAARSEERRVGKEGGRTLRSRWSPDH